MLAIDPLVGAEARPESFHEQLPGRGVELAIAIMSSDALGSAPAMALT